MSYLKRKLLITSLILLSVNTFAADEDPFIEAERKDPTEINGSINFSGKITDSSCDITQKDIDVDLKNHSAALLKNRDDRTPPENFDIAITNCSLSMKSLQIKMTGAAHNDNPALFALDANDKSAGNVGIVITTSGNYQITPAEGYRDITLTPDSRDYTLTYSAGYQATGLATPGEGNATINYTVSYE
ncbi:fimbrial protein [Morganella morganii]|uniref:fimbrial protein n=1 Tax=Morganella morganii TaxID=582 RepID=UPI0032DBED4D